MKDDQASEDKAPVAAEEFSDRYIDALIACSLLRKQAEVGGADEQSGACDESRTEQFGAAHGSLSLGEITTGAETGMEWEAERAELLAAVKWGRDMIKALVNHAGGEVVLQKETCETRGRLEVIPRGDQIYVRCWKGMDQ